MNFAFVFSPKSIVNLDFVSLPFPGESSESILINQMTFSIHSAFPSEGRAYLNWFFWKKQFFFLQDVREVVKNK